MEWDPHFLERSPVFEPLCMHADAFGDDWPDIAGLQHLLERRVPPVCNAGGAPLRLVPPGRKGGALPDKYEARIRLKGELPVRHHDWHDLFNVLVWLAFPRAKAALNARHYAALVAQHAGGAVNRGPVQDALTLFDEGGVIVSSDDEELIAMLHAFRWKELFWNNRDRVRARMRFHVFGHALYEKALQPFPGVTGRGMVLRTALDVLSMPIAAQLALLDARVAERLRDPHRLTGTRELAVVPVLGVPGWCAENESERFYDDTDYFRPGRRTPTRALPLGKGEG